MMSTAPDSSAAVAASLSLKTVSTTSFTIGSPLAPVIRIGDHADALADDPLGQHEGAGAGGLRLDRVDARRVDDGDELQQVA